MCNNAITQTSPYERSRQTDSDTVRRDPADATTTTTTGSASHAPLYVYNSTVLIMVADTFSGQCNTIIINFIIDQVFLLYEPARRFLFCCVYHKLISQLLSNPATYQKISDIFAYFEVEIR